MDTILSYEEDLQTNPFYMKLMNKSSLLQEITINNWIVAVPKRVTLNEKCLSNHEFLLAHVLIPSDELPKTHFYNMIGEEVIINGKFIKLKSDAAKTFTILFEEFFYTKDLQKFKLLCLDTPLSTKFTSKESSSQIVGSVEESWELILEVGKKQGLRKVENAVKSFSLRIQKTSDYSKIENNLKLLYDYCVNIACKKKMKDGDPFLYTNLKIALEYIIMDVAYEKIFDVISIQTSEESQKFNKIMRKLSSISLEDLKISSLITNERLNPLKLELIKIDNYKCSLDKLTCIKNVIDGIASLSEKKMTITDEMLPILVYLVIKTSYFHWIPTLKFIKEFNLSQVVNPDNKSSAGALLYILTTLEAVIYFIQTNENLNLESNQFVRPMKVDEISCKEDYLQYLFDYIKENNEIQLTKMLQVPFSEFKNSNKEIERSDCHPLCRCDKCEARGGFNNEISNVNVPSYEGLTMLHIAAIYNLPKIVTLLTNHEADVNLQDSKGMSPLHYGAALGHQQVLFLLLHSESNLNLRNNKQQTPLILAAMNGHEHCVKALLFFAEHTHSHIDYNAQDSDGNTALHHSAQSGFEIIVDILLEYQAKATLKNNFGKIALDYAFNSVMHKKLEDAIKYQVEELPITESEFIFIRSDDLADIFKDDN